jgi:hypothetical protein
MVSRDDIINLARQHGKPVQEQNAEVEYLFTLEGINALLAAERERIIAQNAPEIEKINEHIKALEEARKAEREACAKVCDARYMGDNNREDMEARRCAAAIRARGQE